jgi:hypothetical protein
MAAAETSISNPASSLVASVGNRDQWKNNGSAVPKHTSAGGFEIERLNAPLRYARYEINYFSLR